jgi:carbohydrate-selective porin OprB
MSERLWIWQDKEYIKENIHIHIDANNLCNVFLHQVYYSDRTKLKISNLNVLTHQFEILNSDSTSITFRIV